MNRTMLPAGVLLLAALTAALSQDAGGPVLAAAPPAQPPLRLHDTGLYAGAAGEAIAPANRPFAPQYPLWSDGLVKRRWAYLPPGTAVDAADIAEWRFPEGTRLWKEFSLGTRRVETRMLWKTAAGWQFAVYAWNDAGTEAHLAPDDGVRTTIGVAPGRFHTIPAKADCAACHGTRGEAPLGFNALQLSTDRDPHAIHGEPLPPGALTLQGMMEEGLLVPARTALISDPPRIRTRSPETRAVLGYLASNCGICHNGRGEIAALAPVIRLRDLLEDGDAVARRMEGAATRWQIPGVPDGASVVVQPGIPDHSALLARMRSRSPSSQMPPLGTAVRDRDAVEAVTRWIAGSSAP